MAEFGITPREAIAEALEREVNPPRLPFRLKAEAMCWTVRFSKSDLLNLLDVLAWVDGLSGQSLEQVKLSEWARDLRISILASLGLEEK